MSEILSSSTWNEGKKTPIQVSQWLQPYPIWLIVATDWTSWRIAAMTNHASWRSESCPFDQSLCFHQIGLAGISMKQQSHIFTSPNKPRMVLPSSWSIYIFKQQIAAHLLRSGAATPNLHHHHPGASSHAEGPHRGGLPHRLAGAGALRALVGAALRELEALASKRWFNRTYMDIWWHMNSKQSWTSKFEAEWVLMINIR